jgi:regulator of replication initiation timing
MGYTPVDNDLLTTWLNALLLDEQQIRELVEQIQALRNQLADDDRARDAELEAENAELRNQVEELESGAEEVKAAYARGCRDGRAESRDRIERALKELQSA